MLLELIIIGLGITLLMKGADSLVDGSSKIAKKFNIPEIVIGLTIVAIGTSLPELVISVDSAIKGFADISLGNVIGSNIANLFLIISLCAIIKPLAIKREVKYIENIIVVLCTGLLYLVIKNDGLITKFEGIALLAICGLYILYNVVMSRVGNKFDEDNIENEEKEKDEEVKSRKIISEKTRNSVFFQILQIIIGIVGLKIGGDLVVDNAVLIAEALNISEKLISLTIVAFGTSLPELITCISATRRQESDLAIGNIIGSNIFNILLIVGVSATIAPISSGMKYMEELTILAIGNIIFAILPFIGEKNKIGRSSGIAFVSFYLIYMISMVYENLNM